MVNNENKLQIVSEGLINILRYVSIYKRLIIAFCLVIIIPNLIIAISNYQKYTAEIKAVMTKNLQFITDMTSKTLDNHLMNYEKISLKINTDEVLISLLGHSKGLYMEDKEKYKENLEYQEYKKQISNILFENSIGETYIFNLQVVTDYDQYSQVSKIGYKKGGYIKDLKAFRNSENYLKTIDARGYPVWFDTTSQYDTYISQSNDTITITDHLSLMRSIIEPRTKEHLGVLVLNINLNFIKNNMDFKNLSGMGNILLVTPQGSLLSLNENIHAPTISNDPDILERIFSSESGQFEYTIDGNVCQIFCINIFGTDYFIVHVVENDFLYQNAKQIKNVNFNIVVICIILALIAAYVVTLSIAQPLNQLKSKMKRAGKDNLNTYYNDLSTDEIGVLGNYFNNMIKDINDLIREIYITEIEKNAADSRKKEAELNALQMQINPHFLYNTLDIIRWEALYHNNGESKLSKMIEDFSALLRLGVKTTENLVVIEEEFRHIDAYIKVINYKFDTPINLKYDIRFDFYKYKIAKLLLQPLVENAVIHGFIHNNEKKEILIEGSIINDTIYIHIIDNGQGISQEDVHELNQLLNVEGKLNGSSIGLANVNERIKLYFGEKYGIYITSEYGKGTKVTISIPRIGLEGEE